jgi:hypothetical protein
MVHGFGSRGKSPLGGEDITDHENDLANYAEPPSLHPRFGEPHVDLAGMGHGLVQHPEHSYWEGRLDPNSNVNTMEQDSASPILVEPFEARTGLETPWRQPYASSYLDTQSFWPRREEPNVRPTNDNNSPIVAPSSTSIDPAIPIPTLESSISSNFEGRPTWPTELSLDESDLIPDLPIDLALLGGEPILPFHRGPYFTYTASAQPSSAELFDSRDEADYQQGKAATSNLKCGSCEKVFNRPADLHKHELVHIDAQDRKYRCDVCDAPFHYPKDVERHKAAVHPDGDEPKYFCTVSKCPRAEGGTPFLRKDKLQEHLRKAHDIKALNLPSSSSSNERVACECCTRSFTGEYAAGNLRRHIRHKHSDANYSCFHCPRMFSRPDARLRHMRKVHPQAAHE